MKHLTYAVLFLVVCGHSAGAQPGTGSWELSLSATFGMVSQTSEMTFQGQTTKDEHEAEGYLSLAVRPGFYLYEGLSLEPEFFWTASEGVPPAFSISGNISYTFVIPASPACPFLLAGYGVGNGIPLAQRLLGRSSDEMDIAVLNLGGGIKIFLSKAVALRGEYRYQRFSWEDTSPFGSTSYRQTVNFHNFLLGFSVFLPAG